MKQERQIMAIVQQQFKDISEPEAIKKYFDELYKAKDPILDEKKIKELSSEMAFAVGHISGGHFNPAVTIGLWAGGRFPAKEVVGYVIAQVVGGIVAAALLYLIASGKTGFDAAASGFASNGYGEHSPGGYSMLSALVVELVLSAGFLLVIHGATDKFAPAGFAPIAIGLALTLIHLISIPVTNTSVNPARSTAVAIFQGGWALEQLWFFWVVPIVGGIIGGLIYRTLLEKRD